MTYGIDFVITTRFIGPDLSPPPRAHFHFEFSMPKKGNFSLLATTIVKVHGCDRECCTGNDVSKLVLNQDMLALIKGVGSLCLLRIPPGISSHPSPLESRSFSMFANPLEPSCALLVNVLRCSSCTMQLALFSYEWL